MKLLTLPTAPRRMTLTLAVLLALAGCGADEAALLASARQQIAKNDLNAARLQLKTLLQDKPDSAEGRLLLGQVLHDAGDMAGAEIELRRAMEGGQSDSAVLPLLAEALLGQNKGRLLVEQYGKVQLPDARAAAALKTTLAKAEAADNDLAAAEATLAQALQAVPDHAPALLMRVRLAAAGGDLPAALRQLDALLAAAPDLAEGWALKGDLLLRSQPADAGAAATAWQKAVQLKPDLVGAHVALLNWQLRKPDIAAATQQWTALQKAAPKHPQTLFYEAVLAEQRGDLPRARELCQLLLRNAPNNPQLLLLAGQTELKLGGLALAEAHFSKAASLVPKAAAPRRLLAQVQLRTGQTDKALATLRPLVEANPPDADALIQTAQAQLIAGDAKAADATFARLAKLKPGDNRARTALALSQLSQGKDASAIGELQAIAAADPGTVADMALISARMQRGDFAGALKAVDALAPKLPGQPLPDQLRGRIALAHQDNAAARKAFDQAVAKDADFMPALAGLAMLDLADKQPAAAKARFEAVLARHPNHSAAMMALAELAARSGAPAEESVQWLERAVKSDPANPGPRTLLIDQHMATRALKPALTAAQAAVTALPDNAELLDRLGRLQLMTGDPQQAISSFNKLAGLQPKSPLPQLRLADAQAAAGNTKAVAAAVRRAAEIAPDALAVQQAQVKLAIAEGKPEQGLAAARAVQAKLPDEALGYLLESDIDMARRQWDSAAATLRKALVRKQPGDSLPRLHAALVAAGKTAEADKLAADWRKAHPDDLGLVMHLGDMALRRGDLAGAEQEYRQVLARQPANVTTLNNLAYVLARQNKAGGVALMDKALALSPDSPALLDTMALCLAAEQQLPRALELQAKAVAAAPGAPQFRLQLAKLQLQAGDKAQARSELDKLAKLGASYPRQNEVAELLKAAGG